MPRFYNFIQGDDPELDWSPVINFMPKDLKKKSSKVHYTKLLNINSPLPFVSERIILISDHGNNCRLFCDPEPPLFEIIEFIVDRLPADKIFIHFSGCELLSPDCTNISKLIGVDPRVCAISGYGESVSFKEAAKLDAVLLRCLYQIDELSFKALLALKNELNSIVPERLYDLGFQFHLN